MRLLESKAELLQQGEGLDGLYKHIELCGRTCYKSTDKMTEDSAKPFVDRMIKSGHCYTGDSEVLTKQGWIKWKDYAGQPVATINSNLSFKGFEIPERIVKYDYTGKFYEYPSLGLKVTDGHRMFGLFRTKDSDFYNSQNYQLFQCNEDYTDQNGREKTLGERMFKTPKHCSKPIHTDPYMELVGFWLGDGCHCESTPNKLVFHLKKERKIEYLKELARQLGYTFEVEESNYYKISYQNIGKYFNTLYYSNGNKYLNPEDEYSPIAIHSIITGLINSDGSLSINTSTITYTSTSKSIIDWICTYGPIAGYTVSYRGICNTPTDTQKPCYKILFLDTDYTINNDSRNRDSKVLITVETNEVFCVTVSTGLILVRGTNGVTTVCGNCAMLEHGTVYLKMSSRAGGSKYKDNKYSKAIFNTKDKGWYITTNLRVLVENGWLKDLRYLCTPTELHAKRYTFRVITSIGVTREFNRHRVNSIAEQSTRYCNFTKDKFDNEIKFIRPVWMNLNLGIYTIEPNEEHLGDVVGDGYIKPLSDRDPDNLFITHCLFAEDAYEDFINAGWQPQQAREVLPLCTATEVCYTAFEDDWKNFADLRLRGTTGKPHPNMQHLAELMQKECLANHIMEDIWKD